MQRLSRRQVKIAIGAIVVLVLPFVLFVGTERAIVVNGALVEYDRTNFLSLGAALIGLWMAWAMAFQWETDQDNRPIWKAVAAVIALGAVLHGLLVLGVF